jgi:dihydropteroate synthase
MGVVNVTPDSFSDGGRFHTPDAAIAQGLRMVEQGADLLDIGGESTRPKGKTYGEGATTVPVEEEIARVVPVIRGLRARVATPISIDTRKSEVARAAIEAGADLVNDVTGLLHDSLIADVVVETGVDLILMHTPRDIEALVHEEPSADVLTEVLTGLEAAIARARGLPKERLLLDPGLGFGKTVSGNLQLLKHLDRVCALGYPVLVGASRKAFLAKAAAGEGGAVAPATERLGASVGAAVTAYLNGAHILRVHDVFETVQALRVAAAIRRES